MFWKGINWRTDECLARELTAFHRASQQSSIYLSRGFISTSKNKREKVSSVISHQVFSFIIWGMQASNSSLPLLFLQLQLYGFNVELYSNLSDAQQKPNGVVGISIMIRVSVSKPSSTLSAYLLFVLCHCG
jgi:hypothetical protein